MTMGRLMWVCLVLLLGAGIAPEVHAWGDTGHRIICEIAFQELNPQARAEVKRLIRLIPSFDAFRCRVFFRTIRASAVERLIRVRPRFSDTVPLYACCSPPVEV